MANAADSRDRQRFAALLERLYALSDSDHARPVPWFAELAGVTTRTVYRWLDGTIPIPQYAWRALDLYDPDPVTRPPDIERVFVTVHEVRQQVIRASQSFLAELETIEHRLVRLMGYDPARLLRFQDVRKRTKGGTRG